MNKNDAESVIKETIEYANKEISKTKKKSVKTSVIVGLVCTVVVVLLFVLGYTYANTHYAYIPYESTGITCSSTEMRTSKNYAQLIGVTAEYEGENIEFIFLCSSPVSERTELKGETTIEDFSVESEFPVDKVYYLSESQIADLPFIYSQGYMPVDLSSLDAGQLVSDSTLVWSAE
ncbi:MAG: hypothetical protein J5883_02100 [Clostridiales bacterium]|nr:hypothetical protein [Clostridiales bacterium]